MIYKTISFLTIAALLCSCSPQLRVVSGAKIEAIYSTQGEIYVFGGNEEIPGGARYIGEVETKGNFFSTMNVRVNESIELLKTGAAQMNGNALVTEEIAFPGPFKSKSYDIRAKVYNIKDLPDKSYNLVTETTDNGMRYVKLYRPKNTFGSGLSYPVYLNEQFVLGLDNNRKVVIELGSARENNYLEFESYGELYKVPILFENNSTIYVECKVSKDGSPKVEFPDIEKGEKEFSKVKYAP